MAEKQVISGIIGGDCSSPMPPLPENHRRHIAFHLYFICTGPESIGFGTDSFGKFL
jgi:hypothetical protein